MERLLPRFDQASDMATATNSINDAKNTGQNAINSFDPTTTAGAQKTGLGDSGLGGLLGGETNNYTKSYQDAVAKNPSVQQLYQQGNAQFNVPQLASTANYLQNQVTNAVPDAYQAAKGFDIDNADIQNGVASKLSYLEPQSNAATNNYNTASQLASNFVQAGQAQNAQNLLPVQAQGGLVTQQEASQAMGWNQANANQLQALIDKMNAGVTLSSAEMQTAQQLAATEEAYNANVVQANAGIQEANIKNTYQTLNPNQTLYNTTNKQHYNPLGGLANSMTG